MAANPYPVSYFIQRPEQYNRLTVFFRLILVIPQYIVLFGFPFTVFGVAFGDNAAVRGLVLPLLTAISLNTVLGVLVFLAWFAILFTGRFPASFLRTCLSIFRWQQNVFAYMYLLAAPYPPFGPGPYPLSLGVDPPETHNRLTTFFRAILVIPHWIVLWFLGIALAVITFIAWFAILITGQYPASMYEFSTGVVRWSARVAAYIYLFVDDYPPFSLSEEPGASGLQAQPA